jgi:integrase
MDNKPMNQNSYVFVRTSGELLLPSAVSHAFKRMVRQLDIADVRFHDLRHTHATHCFAETKDVQVVQKRLGHSRLSTTMDIYTHIIDNNRENEVVDKLEEALDTFSKQEIDGIEEAETLEKMWQK